MGGALTKIHGRAEREFAAPEKNATLAADPPDVTNGDATKVKAVANQMRDRGLRWLVKHEYLVAIAAQDMGEWRHAGGWSVDASVHLPGWDRHGFERLARYCARPALAASRLGRLNDDLLVYRLRRPAIDGRTEILLSPLQFLARLVDLLAPPRKHRHRYCGVLAPRARLRPIVTATAGPAGTVQQELAAASKAMDLAEGKRPASRSWAMLLARIYENRPLQCPRCGQAMTILAFILDQQVIERILHHIGEETTPPRVLPARSPPHYE